MYVTPIPKIRHWNGLSISHNRSQNPNNILICDSIFFPPTMIPADDIILLANLQDPMQHIFPARPSIQRDIVFLTSSLRRSFNDHQISSLTKQRHHTGTTVGVNQLPGLLNLLFKCRIIHQSLRCISILQGSLSHL